MRDHVPGEQYAQVDNADPFTAPVWRSPVHRTPEWVIWLVQLIRLLIRVIWFLIRHPLLDAAAGIVVLTSAKAGWPGVVILVNVTVAVLVTLRLTRPDWYARLVTVPAKSRWRWWCYRRRWQPVMTIAGLAPMYRGRVTVPVLGKVQAGPCADLVTVRLVSGQSPTLFADRASELAHGFGVLSCRIRTAPPGMVVLELVRRDALAAVIPALPIPATSDLRALPVGRCEDGSAFTIRLHGTHLLIAGATAPLLWGSSRQQEGSQEALLGRTAATIVLSAGAFSILLGWGLHLQPGWRYLAMGGVALALSAGTIFGDRQRCLPELGMWAAIARTGAKLR